MLVCKKIDISDGIDVDISDKSKEYRPCHYWYFLFLYLALATDHIFVIDAIT